ncbi:MAG: TerB N-terminal domain-containing protein [Cyanophyceae cyanobacterium]
MTWLTKIIEELRLLSSQPKLYKPQRPKNRRTEIYQPSNNQPSNNQSTNNTPYEKASAMGKRSPSARWIPPGQMVEIKGHVIPGGMVYVGQGLKSSHMVHQTDPCLINPNLNVSSRPYYEVYGLSYHPTYSRITPQHRGAYLKWLAEGRRDRSVPIGYVCLFFYGLERRVLTDYPALSSKDDVDIAAELAQIVTEVEGLFKTYGYTSSFGNYASKFLSMCRILQDPESLADLEPSWERKGWELPLEFKVVLGRKVAAGQPISLDWLWNWYIHSDRVQLKTAASRCETEFRTLLKAQYQQQYGEGMVIKPNKRKLEVRYYPVSSGFSTGVTVDVRNMPDVTCLSSPLNRLQALINQCVDVLDPYSRWLGRYGDKSDPKPKLALLPLELIEAVEDKGSRDYIRFLRCWLLKVLGTEKRVVVNGKQLLMLWDAAMESPDRHEKVTKGESTLLIQGLEKLGFGIEPDVRFGGRPLRGDSAVVLFALGDSIGAVPARSSESSEHY